jgi:hypothetical protein
LVKGESLPKSSDLCFRSAAAQGWNGNGSFDNEPMNRAPLGYPCGVSWQNASVQGSNTDSQMPEKSGLPFAVMGAGA